MNIMETNRLILRHITPEDAPFILELMNNPSWLQCIGDNGVRTLEDAHNYIIDGPMAMYTREGFGLYLTALKDDHTPLGICGLIKRDSLKDVDIGFAFLPQFWSHGYAYEASSAVLAYGRKTLGLERIVAITTPDNERSAHLLEKLGMHFERLVTLNNSAQELCLFVINTLK